MKKTHFASDNTSGICPEAWSATERANHGRLPSYRDDEWTDCAANLIRDLFETDAWLRHARHANAMATRLAGAAQQLPGISIKSPVQKNGVFFDVPGSVARFLIDRGWVFYNFIGDSGYRFMCSWATTPGEIDALVEDMHAATS